MGRRRSALALLCLITAAALALASTGCGRNAASAADDEKAKPGEQAPIAVEMTTASVRPMDVVVRAQGTLAPSQGASSRIAPVAAGRLTEVRVREGDRVTAGQVVTVVENRTQQAQTRSAAAALATAERQAAEAELAASAAAADQKSSARLATLALDAARLDRDNAAKQAQIALDSAQADLRKLRAGSRPQEIAQAEQTVVQARATRDRAATELERVQLLYDKGIYAKRQLEDAKTALDVANSALASAQQQASLVSAGNRPEDIRAGELRVDSGREALDQAKKAGDAHVAQARAALRQARQSVLQISVKRQDAMAMHAAAAQKRADLAAAQTTAGYAELRSPVSGIVTRRFLNPGDMADTTNPVIEVAAVRSLDLVCGLPADEGSKVEVGMRARVHPADEPAKLVNGRVIAAGQVDPQTNLMTVRIAVGNPGGALRAGAFASADIVLRADSRAVVVPKQAIVQHEGKSVVFTVDAGGVAHEHDVAVGAEQGDLVEVLSGVKPGDRVIKLGQYELTDGAKVTESTPQAAEKDKE